MRDIPPGDLLLVEAREGNPDGLRTLLAEVADHLRGGEPLPEAAAIFLAEILSKIVVSIDELAFEFESQAVDRSSDATRYEASRPFPYESILWSSEPGSRQEALRKLASALLRAFNLGGQRGAPEKEPIMMLGPVMDVYRLRAYGETIESAVARVADRRRMGEATLRRYLKRMKLKPSDLDRHQAKLAVVSAVGALVDGGKTSEDARNAVAETFGIQRETVDKTFKYSRSAKCRRLEGSLARHKSKSRDV